jgi:hypothetical protein
LQRGVYEISEIATSTCLCSFRLLCAVRAEGQRLGFLLFFDDEPGSESHGERVRECPGCGAPLGLLALLSEYRTK